MIEPSDQSPHPLDGTAQTSDLITAVRAVTRLSRVIEAASDGLTGADYRVLAMISGGEARAARLAERLRLGKPAISSSIDSLDRRGLIVKTPVDGDSRAVALSLSAAGEAQFARSEARMTRQLELLAERTSDPAATVRALAEFGGVIDASMRAHSAPAGESGSGTAGAPSNQTAGEPSPLIGTEELAGLLGDPRVVILDVRWRLDRPDGRPDYNAGHIPGAVYVDLDTQLAEPGAATEGRHPLPSVERLQASARSWGIDAGNTVVVYDDLKNMSSARAWWLLRYAGIADVRVLDGALAAWVAAGLPLGTGADQEHGSADRAGTVELHYGQLPVLTIDEAAALPNFGVLLDARAPERYRGEVEPIDPKAGHIPGAVNAPMTDNVAADGRFRGADELRARYAALGADGESTVGVYCGSGVTAAHDVLALRIAGMDAALYPGSWSQWSNTEGRPVETG